MTLKARGKESHSFQEIRHLLQPSIIFSCWTRSLDLVSQHLGLQQIKYARIDGTYSLSQRQKILGDYHTDAATRILLMTTGTGAVGYDLPPLELPFTDLTSLDRLNLTIANCVYILEPQWNPMVENQAIGRVLRLGQSRNVKVVRYIVKGTVEEVSFRSVS
jgi:SWI/SNF-related matrix-associated actin-dependent regulator of chromatin subfamily A3